MIWVHPGIVVLLTLIVCSPRHVQLIRDRSVFDARKLVISRDSKDIPRMPGSRGAPNADIVFRCDQELPIEFTWLWLQMGGTWLPILQPWRNVPYMGYRGLVCSFVADI